MVVVGNEVCSLEITIRASVVKGMDIVNTVRRGPHADITACMQRTSTRSCEKRVMSALHALRRTYQSKHPQVWSKGPCTGAARARWRFGVHREMAEGHTTDAIAR